MIGGREFWEDVQKQETRGGTQKDRLHKAAVLGSLACILLFSACGPELQRNLMLSKVLRFREELAVPGGNVIIMKPDLLGNILVGLNIDVAALVDTVERIYMSIVINRLGRIFHAEKCMYKISVLYSIDIAHPVRLRQK